jgi:hypothetical protein
VSRFSSVDVFFDCPWNLIGKRKLEQMLIGEESMP